MTIKQAFISWVNETIQDTGVASLIWDYSTVDEDEAYIFLKDWDYRNWPTKMPLESHTKLRSVNVKNDLNSNHRETNLVWVCQLDGFHDFIIWLHRSYCVPYSDDVKTDYDITRIEKDPAELENFIKGLESQGYIKYTQEK